MGSVTLGLGEYICRSECDDCLWDALQAAKQAEREHYIQGDEASAMGAIFAGCSFFGGYPITPASEVAEVCARELPNVGGYYLQFEDELAPIAGVVGSAWAGAKAMTATSGPGFSLMQETIGYACMTETPCVIVDVQRSGPSTGQATSTFSGSGRSGGRHSSRSSRAT